MPDLTPPPVWQHFILSCAVPVPGGICGEFIESEPCPAHGTEVRGEKRGLPILFWMCLNKAHKDVTWAGDVASCDTCGLTSEMTGRYRELVRRHERHKIAQQVRAITEDDGPWHTATRKFIDRHPRLIEGTNPVAVLLAAADEIENGDDHV